MKDMRQLLISGFECHRGETSMAISVSNRVYVRLKVAIAYPETKIQPRVVGVNVCMQVNGWVWTNPVCFHPTHHTATP
jgi:hypothetical protein